MTIQYRLQRWCLQHLSGLQRLLWLLAALALAVALACGWRLQQLAARNVLFRHPAQMARLPDHKVDAYWAYARGIALQAQPERALNQFHLPEASPEPRLRAAAKLAIGNLYFDWAMSHHAVEQGGAHQQQVAMIALAREAYKDALRIEPTFAEARFNLELLDRRSPDKRTQGWQSETDGVTLKPFKRNGTAMMRDNRRRGLP